MPKQIVEWFHHPEEFNSDALEEIKEDIETYLNDGWLVKAMTSPTEGTVMVVFEREGEQDGK